MFVVEHVEWERIHLQVEIRMVDETPPAETLQFYLVNKSGQVKSAFRILSLTPDHFSLSLNITNSGVNRCIPNGTYRILVSADEKTYETALFLGKAEELAAMGRNFNYLSNKGTYTVSFMVDEYSEQPELLLLFFNAKTGTYSDKALPGVKRKREPLKKRIKKSIISKLRNWMLKSQERLYRHVRKQYKKKAKKHILFLSEKDEKLALNMEAVYQRMLERGLDKDYVIDFSLRNSAVKKYSKLSTARMTLQVAKASIILVDDHVPLFDRLMLDKDTRLIQIWHAGAGFKGVGYSRWGHFGCPGVFSCHRQYTYCLSGSKAISHFFSEQFGILDEQIIPTGMPRMDAYMDPVHREETCRMLYERYPQFKDRHVVLFAPTYRGQTRKNAYYPYQLIDFEGLYRYCLEKDAVILFKMHPWVASEVPIKEAYQDRFFNLNDYPSINDLFYITDLLITDYSSSMYEFLLMNKPMLFFPFDKNQYATSRGFHRDYDSNVPGKICKTFDELLRAMNAEEYEFEKVGQMLAQYFDNVDTHNCDRVIDWLVLDQLPEVYREALEKRQEQVHHVRSLKFKKENSRRLCLCTEKEDGAEDNPHSLMG